MQIPDARSRILESRALPHRLKSSAVPPGAMNTGGGQGEACRLTHEAYPPVRFGTGDLSVLDPA
jgi:hypothetical protein